MAVDGSGWPGRKWSEPGPNRLIGNVRTPARLNGRNARNIFLRNALRTSLECASCGCALPFLYHLFTKKRFFGGKPVGSAAPILNLLVLLVRKKQYCR